jgi:outer membrane protein OmpA-like peptidoglycan-associated protein
MNLTKLNHLLALGLVLGFAAVGCQTKKPTPVTKLPDRNPNVADVGPGAPSTPSLDEKAIDANNIRPTGVSQDITDRSKWVRSSGQFGADTVHFDYDSSAVKASEKAHVTALADYLRSNPSTAIEVQGHCDERGTEEYNRSLGERRAIALREEIVRMGIEANRVDTISFGKDHPVDTATTDAARRKNRRGEFVLLTPPSS